MKHALNIQNALRFRVPLRSQPASRFVHFFGARFQGQPIAALAPDDPRAPHHDPRYAAIDPAKLPLTESLKDTVARVLPFWDREIAPMVRSGKRVLIASHGNSLRALVKHLDKISDEEISELNIPTGIPLVYHLEDDLTPIKRFYLGDQDAIARAAQAVADQTRKG